jgi:YegS/Rv2252/BmrU family lipid kinase
MAEEGISLIEAKLFDANEELVSAVGAAVKRGDPMVIVGGGDGTISSVVQLLEGTETVLGIMPFGTGNALARDLAVPTDVDQAVEIIAKGKIAHIDVGIANGRRFMNVATLGLSTLIAQDLSTGIKKVFAAAAYAIAVARALLEVKPFKAVLTLEDGTAHEIDALQIVIGNGRFHAGGLLIKENAAIDEGFLSVYALATTHKFAFLKLALRLRAGNQAELDEVRSFQTRRMHLETTPSRKVILDGEPLLLSPIDFSISGKKVRVAVPSDWDSHSENPSKS